MRRHLHMALWDTSTLPLFYFFWFLFLFFPSPFLRLSWDVVPGRGLHINPYTTSYIFHYISALSLFLLFVFQGVFPCMEYSIESVTLATAAFFVWTLNCNLTLTLTCMLR